jgi:hypothetical protein
MSPATRNAAYVTPGGRPPAVPDTASSHRWPAATQATDPKPMSRDQQTQAQIRTDDGFWRIAARGQLRDRDVGSGCDGDVQLCRQLGYRPGVQDFHVAATKRRIRAGLPRGPARSSNRQAPRRRGRRRSRFPQCPKPCRVWRLPEHRASAPTPADLASTRTACRWILRARVRFWAQRGPQALPAIRGTGSRGLARYLVGATELGRRPVSGHTGAHYRHQRHAGWVGRDALGRNRHCLQAAVGRHGRARVAGRGSANWGSGPR